MEEARPATVDDLDTCTRLLGRAAEAASRMRGGTQLLAGGERSGLLAAPASWMGAPDRLLLAGTFTGAIVGVAAGRLQGRGRDRVGVVDCCYVEEAARRVGVGSALLQALLAWFAERGCAAVDAPALPGDRSTKQLFEGAGLSARLLVLHRRLP